MTTKKSEIFIVTVLATIIVALSFLLLFYKDSTSVLGKIDDYDSLLNGETNPKIVFAKLTSNGFTQKDYDAQTFFGQEVQPSTLKDGVMIGDYLFFTAQNRHFLSDGITTSEVHDNLRELYQNGEIRDLKYVFSLNKKQGLKDIFGNVIINNVYDNISFKGDTALAEMFLQNSNGGSQNSNSSIVHIYYQGVKKGETADLVEICVDSRYISINSRFYDLQQDFTPENPLALTDIIKGYIGDYTLLSPSQEIFKIFNSKTGLIGYANKDGILLEPIFLRGDDFINGCARATLKEQAVNVFLMYNKAKNIVDIIDLDNKNLAEAQISPFYNKYSVCYDPVKKYFVIDKDFNIVSPSFSNLYSNVLGGFALDLASNRFYSIAEQKYCLEPYNSVLIYDGYYVCQKLDGKYAFIDFNLQVLADNLLQVFYFENNLSLLINYSDNFYVFNGG